VTQRLDSRRFARRRREVTSRGSLDRATAS
jgi:hypothetical protein